MAGFEVSTQWPDLGVHRGQREIGADDPPVGALMEIGGIPVEARVVFGPVRHVARFGVDRGIATLGVVLVVPGDVVEAGGARGPAGARARAKRFSRR